MPNTPPCTDTSASHKNDTDSRPRKMKRESSPYPGSSLLSRINRRFQNLTSPSRSSLEASTEQTHTTSSTVEDPSISHTPQYPAQTNEDKNREALSQQTTQELEDLQARYQDMQAELARYRERCEELEELCRDFQVTFLSNYLESQKVEGEVRDVLQNSGMRWMQAPGQNPSQGNDSFETRR
ncbi:uncharacterized protein BDV14DRAFT_203445 [Aspergillus stella-maris]|uniref:uncharacterized protein n=1 Tax=Aspergillus stella-maris TaxID=1810926 RepID=UPI003CCDD86C